MKFVCDKQALQNCVETAAQAASQKSSIPALEGVMLETVGQTVKFYGFDLKTGIITTLPADIIREGSIVLDAKLFCDIIRRLPNDDVTVDVSDNMMTYITCGLSHFEIMGSGAQDYPDLPTVDYQKQVKIQSGKLKMMIAQTGFAVSADETRPIHTGSLFEIEEDKLTIVSVDGFRLAVRKEPYEEGTDVCSFVVPGNALNEVEKILDESDMTVGIYMGAKHIMFIIGDTVLITRRLEGEFLNYKKAIPEAGGKMLKVDRREMLSSVERVSLIISDQLKTPIRCFFGDGILKLNSMTPLGKASDECDIEGDGGELEIGFNNRYLMDALKAAPSDTMYLNLTSPVSPCVLRPADGDIDYTYMILPVRLSK